ncbi:PREDICTED: STAM-binding protein-like [Priapulus caudatus]|uniref:STAM-binding protein-like n=1 Tax=Priapulus caudatus TaxID=37621 RepID=A0ABM1ETT4_PRICU|nr:PREDICTED: STAM-binding protein-like [Priapulus caudatus]
MLPDIDVRDPSGRVRALSRHAGLVEVDHNIPPKRYCRSGLEMIRMADVYMEERNLPSAFVLYSKYVTLFVEKFPKHPDYNQVTAEEKEQVKKKLQEVFPKAEKLKQSLLKIYNKELEEWEEEQKHVTAEERRRQELLTKQQEERKAMEEEKRRQLEKNKRAEEEWEWQLLVEQEKQRQLQAREELADVAAAISLSEIQPQLPDAARTPSAPPSMPSRDSKPQFEPPPSYDVSILRDDASPQAGVDRSTKPAHLTSTAGDGRIWKNDMLRLGRNERVMLRWMCGVKPEDRVSSGILRERLKIEDLESTLRPSALVSDSSSASNVVPDFSSASTSASDSNLASVSVSDSGFSLAVAPPLSSGSRILTALVTGATCGLSSSRNRGVPAGATCWLSDWSERGAPVGATCWPSGWRDRGVPAGATCWPTDSWSDLGAPAGLWMGPRQTCGVLAGRLSRGRFLVTHLLVPQQRGTPDSCATENEEDIFACQDRHDLITLGWIHTHPTQTSFLSSVDLHTHCGYQLMLPEAVAVVCAPKYGETGVFSLTPDHGLSFIANCREQGFHPHPSEPPLFEESAHVTVDPTAEATIVDLRK